MNGYNNSLSSSATKMLTQKRFQVEPLDISFVKFHSQADLNQTPVKSSRSGK